MICLVTDEQTRSNSLPHFGFGGPKKKQPPELPLAYLPRLMDNSSGGQVVVPKDVWGPMQEQLLHLSFGMGSWFTVLRDEVEGQVQGAVVPMTGDFLSGVHRGRFSSHDKHLYLSGQQGWVSFTRDDGCFQRIRYTDEEAPRNEYPKRIVSPPEPKRCCNDDNREIVRGLNGYTIRDLGSTNGTLVNNEMIFYEPARPGDRLRTRQILRSVSDPKTTKLGLGRFWVIEVEYLNQNDDLVGRESYTGFGYRRPQGELS